MCGGFTREKLEIWKFQVGVPRRGKWKILENPRGWALTGKHNSYLERIKSISHSRAKALLLLSKHKHMQKFIQNTMNLSWTLFGILTLLIVCGHDGPMDLKNLDQGTQIVLGAWVVLLEVAVIFTCIRMFMASRGRWSEVVPANREKYLEQRFPTPEGKTYIQSLDEHNSKN